MLQQQCGHSHQVLACNSRPGAGLCGEVCCSSREEGGLQPGLAWWVCAAKIPHSFGDLQAL
jgi:hypothetical protein